MKTKMNKRGITLITLAITIIVLIILTGVIVVNGNNSFKSANASMFANEILSLQGSIDNYYERYSTYPVEGKIVFTVPANTTEFNDETISNGSITLNKVDYSLIGIKETGLSFGKEEKPNDTYAISTTTGKVYYLLGVEYDNAIHYTLDNKIQELLGINYSKYNSNNDTIIYDVIFSKNIEENTNEPIVVTVKVPNNATVNSVTATNDKVVGNANTQNGYKVYVVNETGESRDGNYTVTVNYTLNDVTKEAIYNVSNFNNETLSINIAETQNNGVREVSFTTNKQITKAKYDLGTITDEAYFNLYGKTISNNNFRAPQNTGYTIYVEDEYGNSAIKSVHYWKYKKDENNKYTLVTNGVQNIGIGDTIDYEATGTSYTSKWKIFGANENGELLVMAGESPESITLGEEGNETKCQSDWVNAKSILDTACEKYGHGIGASSTVARSVTVDDINKLTGYNPLNTGVYDPDQTATTGSPYMNPTVNVAHNGTKQYTSGTFYNGTSWVTATTEEPVTVTQTSYFYYPKTLTTSNSETTKGLDTSVLKENKVYVMLFKTLDGNSNSQNYWIATTCVGFFDGGANFNVRIYNKDLGVVESLFVFNSQNKTTVYSFGIRPLVSLSSMVNLTSGTETDWKIN